MNIRVSIICIYIYIYIYIIIFEWNYPSDRQHHKLVLTRRAPIKEKTENLKDEEEKVKDTMDETEDEYQETVTGRSKRECFKTNEPNNMEINVKRTQQSKQHVE